MSDLKIVQRVEQVDARSWRWSVMLEAPRETLDSVSQVIYTLHPSFREPVRKITARTSNFRLASKAWGEFMIYARVEMKDGSVFNLNHWLELRSEADGKSSDAQNTTGKHGPRPRVFLSYSVADTGLAHALARKLEDDNITVLSPEEHKLSQSIDVAIDAQMAEADGAIVIVSQTHSPWAEREIGGLLAHHVPIIPVVVAGRSSDLPLSLRNVQSVVIKDSSDIAMAADRIVRRLKTSIG